MVRTENRIKEPTMSPTRLASPKAPSTALSRGPPPPLRCAPRWRKANVPRLSRACGLRLGGGLGLGRGRAFRVEADIDYIGVELGRRRVGHCHFLFDMDERHIELAARNRDRYHEQLGPDRLLLLAFAHQRIAQGDRDLARGPRGADHDAALDSDLDGQLAAAELALAGGLDEIALITQAERHTLRAGAVDGKRRRALTILHGRTIHGWCRDSG